MRRLALGVAVVTAVIIVLAASIPRGPMNHGWDWPWHDWWHSGFAQHGGFHQD